MAKVDLTDVGSGFQTATAQNANNVEIETHLNDKVLYRDNPTGEPNTMQQALDMNSKDVNNTSVTRTGSLFVNGIQVIPGEVQAISVDAAIDVPNTPAGNISATNVQTALNELDTEKVSSSELGSTAADDGTKGFHLVSYPPLSGETGVTEYEYPVGDIRRYGATTAAADNSTAIQNALDSTRFVFIPEGTWMITSKIEIKNSGQEMIGEGRDDSIIQSSGTNNLLELTTTAVLLRLKLKDLYLYADNATSGHVIYQAVGLALSTFDRVRITQTNPDKSLYEIEAEEAYVDVHWTNFDLTHVESATVPGFNLVDTTGGHINSNSWTKGRVTYSGEYFFLFENSGTEAYIYDNFFEKVNFEVCSGGCIKGLGVNNLGIKDCYTYDTPLGIVNDSLYFGESLNVSPLKSRQVYIENYHRRSSVLSGVAVDIMLASGEVEICTIIGGDNATLTGYIVDIGSNVGVIILNARNWTFNNQAATTIIMRNYSSTVAGLSFGGEVRYTFKSGASDTAFIEASAGTATTGPVFPQNTIAGLYTGTGDPQSAVAAGIGSFFSRTDASSSEIAYLKEQGAGNTGWRAVALKRGGNTASRPSSPSNHEMYFDDTLGYAIWFDGTNWVDAAGVTV